MDVYNINCFCDHTYHSTIGCIVASSCCKPRSHLERTLNANENSLSRFGSRMTRMCVCVCVFDADNAYEMQEFSVQHTQRHSSVSKWHFLIQPLIAIFPFILRIRNRHRHALYCVVSRTRPNRNAIYNGEIHDGAGHPFSECITMKTAINQNKHIWIRSQPPPHRWDTLSDWWPKMTGAIFHFSHGV